ncbi:microtubule-associated protein 9 isoform X1 [Phyllopteryx taeniolatus]|uniref:microtubule-associated protein 9 isoform X1 n=1 Tax=Phyllopteryx taeniolatus TaxID=161469 RepID=UPI002AD58F99|nr:microtubule-associated protein 9 isoform X1 [Phyllopteryx taeniolatus]
MTKQAFAMLAYSQSPKTTKRTTFQEELEAALAVRAGKTTSEHLDDDGFDFLDNLLKSRKNRSDAFKASRTKTKINDFDFSDDDDDKQGTKKRTSFLKSPKRISVEGDAIAPQREHEAANSFQLSSEDDKNDGVKLTSRRPADDNSATSPLYRSDEAPPDLPLPPAPVEPERRVDASGQTVCEESFQTSSDADLKCVTTSGIEKETPKPKPRQRTAGLKLRVTEKSQASPSAPLATDTRNITDGSPLERIATRRCSPHLTDGRCGDSCASNGLTLGDTKEQQRAYSTSLEDSNVICDFVPLRESEQHSVAQVSHVQNKCDVRASSSQSKRPNTVCTKKVESKYLGTLKILDCKVSQDCQPASADSLRATVYQEWLKKKMEKSSENVNKQKIAEDQKKKIEEEKKKVAAASYEAWKEKKDEMVKAKTKEEKHRMREEQTAVEKGEEKRKAAEQMFYQWKREHDHLLREKSRQQRETERKLALKKREEEEERRRDSKSAFSNWCEKKSDALYKKVSTERQESENKAEEYRYIQEEKDKLAFEMFEQWLEKKDLQQKRQREDRRIQVILRDSPPPPWSPPNKTVPFRK